MAVPFSEATHTACESDRLFFLNNPDRYYRIRALITGEMTLDDQPEGVELFVVVKRIGAGVRVRVPILANIRCPNHDAFLAPVFDRLVSHPVPERRH